MERAVTEEIIAPQPQEAQAMIRALLDKIAKREGELDERRRQAKAKTPQNSSLPPSTQHPHAKPPGENANRRRSVAASRAMQNPSGR